MDDDNNILGTNGMSYKEQEKVNEFMSESRNGESTFNKDNNLSTAKKTVMNKDIITHSLGGPSSLVVRAMYYTPFPATPEDIIIKVEVRAL